MAEEENHNALKEEVKDDAADVSNLFYSLGWQWTFFIYFVLCLDSF